MFSSSQVAGTNLGLLSAYDKKLERKTVKVNLIKCEGNEDNAHSKNKNKHDPRYTNNPAITNTESSSSSSQRSSSLLLSTTNMSNNIAMLGHHNNVVESDSEYETEEVFELREWYPPDYWKSNRVVDNGRSNLNHLRNDKGIEESIEEGAGGGNNNNNNNNRKRNNKNDKNVSLTDVTVDDLTITMMESQTEKGFFKTLR